MIKQRAYFKQFAILLFLFLSFTVKAQEPATNNEFTGIVGRYFQNLGNIFKEKVYLHTDKPFYAAGDNIWYKGYLVNGLTHREQTPSNFIYIELYNHNDSLITRQKIRRTEEQFFGNIIIPATIVPGDYYLRSYTSWMQNWDNDYFYQKNLTIGNSISKKIESKIEYKKDNKDVYIAEVTLYEDGKPFVNKNVNYQLRNKSKAVSKRSGKSNGNGSFTISLDPLKGENGVLNLELDDKTYKYKNSFIIPSESQEFAVSFFPEGGNLLNGVSQSVAFKVQNSNGFSSVAKGYLLENNDTILEFSTEHSGMGSFNIVPDNTFKYKTVFINSENVVKEFDLPQIMDNGISISVIQSRGVVFYKINATESMPIENKQLIIQTRGKLLLTQPIDESNLSGQFLATDFPEGIIHFLIADSKLNKPVTERLTFIQYKDVKNWDLSMSSKEQKRRGLNEVTLSLKDSEGNPLQGNFSVAITDASLIRPDSLAENIRSGLLISSELKGYIENPGYYTNNNDTKSKRAADLLMMTHGWRKYADFDFAKLPTSPENHYIENGQYLAGIVKNATGGIANNVKVTVWSLDNGFKRSDTTNTKGEYFIQGIEFPDSINFQVRATRFNGIEMPLMSVYPEQYYFPKPGNRNLYSVFKDDDMEEYLKYTSEKYYYEGGMRVYNLKEVDVKGRKESEKSRSNYSSMADFYMTEKKIEERTGLTLSQILQEMPGVYSDNGETVMIRGSSGLPLILINDIQYTGEDGQQLISFTDPLDVERIDILRNANAAIFGTEGANGAISITLKKGVKATKKFDGIYTFSTIGYSKTAEFYKPVYETLTQIGNNIPDLRTTIHWEPVAKTDEAGNIVLKYYNNDSPYKSFIEVEGISENGDIYRFTKEFK